MIETSFLFQVQYTVDLTMIVFDYEVQKSKLARLGENLRQALGGECLNANPSNAEAIFVQSTRAH